MNKSDKIITVSLLFLISLSFSASIGYYYGKTNKEKTDCVAVIDRLLNQMTPFVENLPDREFQKLEALIYARELIAGKK